MSEAELPPFLLPYLPQFRALLEDLDLVEGFVIYPVEVSGHDIARGLANWLGEHGRPAHLVAPTTEAELRDLAPSLLALHPKEGELVVFAGPPLLDADSLPEGLAYGLHLLNQRRDSIKEQLGTPLLWCGPKAFLAATAERAPDFWSVRDLGGKVTKPSEREVWQLPGTLGFPYRAADANEDPARLRSSYEAARRQGDTLNATRIAARLLDILIYRVELEGAAALYDEAQSFLGTSAQEELARTLLLRKKISILQIQEKLEEAIDLARGTLIPTLRQLGKDRLIISAQQILAELLSSARRDREALDLLRRIELDARENLDRPSFIYLRGQLARQLSNLGQLREAERILTKEVIPAFRQMGDARSLAMVLFQQASNLARQGRLNEAIDLVQKEVLPTFDGIDDAVGTVKSYDLLAAFLFQRGHKDDLLDAHNCLIRALRESRRHHLDTSQITAHLREVDRKLAG